MNKNEDTPDFEKIKPLLDHGYELIRLHEWTDLDSKGESRAKVPMGNWRVRMTHTP